jgi:ribonuclease P protein component
MIGRLVHTVDIAMALATAPRSRSTHFAVHHVGVAPSARRRRPAKDELSTSLAQGSELPVDKVPSDHWVGCVVPKRHARRAVTRNLLKRQMRAALGRHAAALQPGLWLVRLRSPFVKTAFPSAASDALSSAAREELDRLLIRAAA